MQKFNLAQDHPHKEIPHRIRRSYGSLHKKDGKPYMLRRDGAYRTSKKCVRIASGPYMGCTALVLQVHRDELYVQFDDINLPQHVYLKRRICRNRFREWRIPVGGAKERGRKVLRTWMDEGEKLRL